MQEAAQYVGGDENVALEVAGPHLIQTLEGHGIPAADIKKLVEAGVHTVEALAHAPVKTLSAIKGLSEVKVTKLKQVGAYRERVVASVLRAGRALSLCSPCFRLVVPSRGYRAHGLHHRLVRAAAASAPDSHHHRLSCARRTARWYAPHRLRASAAVAS
jgi:Helix-hairpin-helix domain